MFLADAIVARLPSWPPKIKPWGTRVARPAKRALRAGPAMAPRPKKVKAKDEEPPATLAPSEMMNEGLNKRLADHLATVMDNKVFKHIEAQRPLAIGAGGCQTPFNATDFNTSMSHSGMYKCGFNFFMLNLSWSATPGVPLVQGRVDMLMNYYFKKASPIPFDLVVRVPSGDFEPMKHVGGLQCVTPEEVKMAFMMAVVRDIEDEAALKEWRRVALSATAVFKLLETDDDVFFEAFNSRERIANDFQSLARTAFQIIHEVAQFRQRKMATWGPGAPLKKLCDEFNRRAELASTSEPVNLDFIQKALAVHDKAFSLPCVVQAIETLESLCKKGSPYDSVHKLAGIVRKAKDTPVIAWVFATITDLVVSKKYHGTDFPHRWLLGDGGRGGAVDLYIMKNRMIESLLSAQLDVYGFPSQVKEKMREVLASHASYRKFLNPVADPDDARRACEDARRACGDVADDDGPKPVADLTWRGNWSRNAIMYLSFVERCCYGEDFDSTLRTASKMGKSPMDVLQYDSFAGALAEVQQMHSKEQEDQRKLAAGLAPEGAAAVVPAAQPGAEEGAAVGGGAASAAEQRLQLEAERIVNSNVTLLIEPDSQMELKSAIMSSNAGKVEGRDGTEYVVIVYDYKQAAESKTTPSTRIAPLRETRATKCIVATIDARRTTLRHTSMGLVPGDMYYMFDGTRSGNMTKLKAGFVTESGDAIPKAERKLVLVYAEEGAARRRQLVRGTGSVKQQEGLMLISRIKPKMSRRRRLHFEGTSAGDAIMNIPAPDDEWQLTVAVKRLLYAHYRVDVGGKEGSDDDDDEDDVEPLEPAAKKKRVVPSKKDEEEKEPTFFFQPARSLVEELLHLSQARAVIDLTAGAGVWALAAMEFNLPYFGLVLTDVHLKELSNHLIRQVKVKLSTPNSKLYMASFASARKPEPKPEPKPEKDGKKPKPPKPPPPPPNPSDSESDSKSPAT